MAPTLFELEAYRQNFFAEVERLCGCGARLDRAIEVNEIVEREYYEDKE